MGVNALTLQEVGALYGLPPEDDVEKLIQTHIETCSHNSWLEALKCLSAISVRS